MVDFGEGCSCCSCCSCDRGKTKSNPSPFDLDWNGLGLEFDKSRKHENCDWCEFICAEESEMKKHKMDKHTIAYSKEVLKGFIAKSP